ncbi:DNA primase [Thermomonas aquatica]|uniref:DNA primase n=1 Tax=Thermomonas aquatica TaxID=2202149 RepID=A0A5B7ZSQ0_9GAMM|nr:DNA primase [Thermomonas aquatica]QDA57553.1 DNA primase [Thermomonas aquatica]
MARIPDAFIDDLLARTDIVEVVQARVPLKRQGKEYASRCPFHDERSASFTVSPTKQFYHCFGCGAHGTAISFLMNYDRLEFLDAVDELAKRVGMEIPRDTQQRNANPETRDLYGAMEAASSFFRGQLANSGKARAYIEKRGIAAEIVERYAIGYAPDGFSALRDTLGTDPRRMQLLERGGLFSKNDKGHVYDKFRDRLMFPIHDRRGRTIAFGGRVIDPEDSPKYLNSPETALFHKGRELYGLWQAKQANAKLDRLIVVEGYMDVVALAQYGVSQAVATLGTATTPDHAELLFRNAPDVYFCFDGDRAGRSAAWKALESVLPRMKDGRQAFFLFLPDGEDPDSIVRQEGMDGFDARLRDATPLSEFYLTEQVKGISLTSFSGKAALADRCRSHVRSIPDGGFLDAIASRIIELTGVDVRVQDAPAQVKGPDTSSAKRSIVRTAITLVTQNPSLASELQPPYRFAALRQPGIELLSELVLLVRERPEISTGALLEHFAERDEAGSLQKLAALNLPGEEDALRAEFLDAMAQLDRQVLQQRLDELQRQQRDGGLNDADKQELRELLQARLAR